MWPGRQDTCLYTWQESWTCTCVQWSCSQSWDPPWARHRWHTHHPHTSGLQEMFLLLCQMCCEQHLGQRGGRGTSWNMASVTYWGWWAHMSCSGWGWWVLSGCHTHCVEVWEVTWRLLDCCEVVHHWEWADSCLCYWLEDWQWSQSRSWPRWQPL